MNVSKIGLFLLMSTASTITLCDRQLATSYTMRVGDYLEIPVGPVEGGYRTGWYYNIMNPEQVYSHLNPTNASNILEHIGTTQQYSCTLFTCLLDYLLGSNVLMESHRVQAIKPGTTTIIYNHVQTVEGCGCNKLIHWEKVDKDSTEEKGTLTQEYYDCKATCENEAKQQATKPYKTVTITVLPAE